MGFLFLVPTALLFAQEETTPAQRYNVALDALRGGDPATAAGIFAELPGADAAQGLGVALFRVAEAPDAEPATNAQMRVKSAKRRIESLEKSAAAFRSALELSPGDAACATNLATTAERLAKVREELADAELEEKYGTSDEVTLLGKLIDAQRAAYASGSTAFADDSPARVRALEKAAGKQRAAAEIWKPLSAKFAAAAQNAPQENKEAMEKFLHDLAVAADCADGAANALEDMNPDAIDAMKKAELSGMGVMCAVAPPPQLLAMSLFSQSNALARAARNDLPRTPVQEQMLAADAFAIVRDRLPDWLAQNQQAQQIDTNEVARLTEEISAEHAAVARGMDKSAAVLPESVLPNAQKAYDDMAELLALLNPPQQNQQQQNQDQQNRDSKDQQDSKSEENKDDQSQNEENRDSSDSENQQEESEENAEEADPAEEDPEREDAEKTMQAVLQQEKDRAAEKRRREQAMPARTGERDW